MKIAMHEITTNRASFDEDLTAYERAGWIAFEMSIDKAQAFIEEHGKGAFTKRVRDSGLRPIACTGHVVRAFGTAEEIRANEYQLRATLEIMAAVGCPTIVFGGDGPNEIPRAQDNSETSLAQRDESYRAQLGRFAGQVACLAETAADYGVTMALEMNWCAMCRSVATAAEAIALTGRENVGLLFDTAHFACTPSRLSDLDAVAGRIVAGHLNDMRNAPPEIRNVNNDRVIPGDGVLPLREWTAKVADCGFDGWYAVEIFCEDLWRESALTIARRVREGCARLWPDAEF